MKKNYLHIIKQPEHAILSIISWGDSKFPLSQEQHEYLDNLASWSDVIFIFPESIGDKISAQGFTNLYQACGYLKEDRIGRATLEILRYEKHIFGSHSSALILNFENLRYLKRDHILNLSGKPLNKPISKICRLEPETLGEVYIKKHWWEKEERGDIYKTHTTDLLFIRPKSFFDSIENLMGEEYMDNFKGSDITSFLASVIKRFGLDWLDEKIEEVRV